jgi:hypothetical protein
MRGWLLPPLNLSVISFYMILNMIVDLKTAGIGGMKISLSNAQ